MNGIVEIRKVNWNWILARLPLLGMIGWMLYRTPRFMLSRLMPLMTRRVQFGLFPIAKNNS